MPGAPWILRLACTPLIVGASVSACASSQEEPQVQTEGSGGASGTSGQDADSASGGGSSSDGVGGESDSGQGCSVFPESSVWNLDVSQHPVHERSLAYIESIGADAGMHPDFGTVWDGTPIGIPYIEVDGETELTPVFYSAYGSESDPGPFPIPLDAPIEGGPESSGDRHVIAWDRESCVLYELYSARPTQDGWEAASGARYDLSREDDHPEGCTSADAAGLPILPGLVRYDEVVEAGEINHALRFTVQRSQRAYLYPARHYASQDSDPALPPMGARFRMKADYDCSSFSEEVQVICEALRIYGMFVADNGSNWYLSGAPDERWDDDALGDLKSIPGSAFEVVDTGATLVTEAPDCSIP